MVTRQRGPGGRFLAAGDATAKPETAKPETAKRETAKTPEMTPTQESAPRSVDLYLVRHADAGDSAAWTEDDAIRPLSKKGRRQSRRLGDLLADLAVRPSLLATSPRLRAADTAKIIGKRIGSRPTVDDRLDWGFDTTRLTSMVADLPGDAASVMLVGHDPAFSDIASWLVGAPLALSKGALARITLPEGRVVEGGGVLRWLLPPDALPR
jgi:phosphohistidine phosphatase